MSAKLNFYNKAKLEKTDDVCYDDNTKYYQILYHNKQN